MISIRRGVFETNSSSTHSISITSEEEYVKWINGELLFNESEQAFVSKKTIKNEKKVCSECENQTKNADKYCSNCGEKFEYGTDDLKTYDDYMNDCDFETYSREFTTKSGDNIVAFGKYGEQY